MDGLLGPDNLPEIQLFENLESDGEKRKIETLRKSPLKLSIYVRYCAAYKNKCFIYYILVNLQNIFMEHDLC